MEETVGETIKSLITADSYFNVRKTLSDEFIDFVRENMPMDYEYFAEKEKAFQAIIEAIDK